jgi:hypothetical protein
MDYVFTRAVALGDKPLNINTSQPWFMSAVKPTWRREHILTPYADERVTHQSDAATTRGGRKEGDTSVVPQKRACQCRECIPQSRRGQSRLLVEIIQADRSAGIHCHGREFRVDILDESVRAFNLAPSRGDRCLDYRSGGWAEILKGQLHSSHCFSGK